MNNVVKVKIQINNNKIEVGYNLTKPNFYISFDHPLIGDIIDYLAKLECMPIEVDSFDKAVFINFKCKNVQKIVINTNVYLKHLQWR